MAQVIEVKKIKVLTEHKHYLPPLTAEEFKNLEMEIKEHGIQTPLLLMKGSTFLLDGHNRLEIAKKLKLKTVPVEVQVTNNAEEWILRHQLSRRNLSELNRDKLMKKLYDNIKKKTGKDKEKELEELKKVGKVSKATLDRVSKQQEAIEALPEEAQKKIAEDGTRRGANKIIQQVQPRSSVLKLKDDVLNYRNMLIGIQDGAINLEEDGLEGVDDMVQKAINPKKLEALITWLEGQAKRLKEERTKEIDAIQKGK